MTKLLAASLTTLSVVQLFLSTGARYQGLELRKMLIRLLLPLSVFMLVAGLCYWVVAINTLELAIPMWCINLMLGGGVCVFLFPVSDRSIYRLWYFLLGLTLLLFTSGFIL